MYLDGSEITPLTTLAKKFSNQAEQAQTPPARSDQPFWEITWLSEGIRLTSCFVDTPSWMYFVPSVDIDS